MMFKLLTPQIAKKPQFRFGYGGRSFEEDKGQ